MMRLGVPGTATLLGLAGLIPFCLAPLGIGQDADHEGLYSELLANYALGIICFLVGIWWGLALIRRSTVALIISNALVIVSFAARSLLSHPTFFLVCAALFKHGSRTKAAQCNRHTKVSAPSRDAPTESSRFCAPIIRDERTRFIPSGNSTSFTSPGSTRI